MIGTEPAALTWWCHKVPRGANDRCVASGCAAWRWATDALEYKQTGKLIKVGVEGDVTLEVAEPGFEAPPGEGWERHGDVIRDPELEWREKTKYASFRLYWSRPRADREGYCGAK